MGERGGPFAGAVVLITGAAGGFGQAMAKRFASESARLVLADRNETLLAECTADLDCETVLLAGDIVDEETSARLVAAALDRFGAIDVAINNAGIATAFKSLHETTAAEAERLIAVNLMGVIHGMRHQLPPMRQRFADTGQPSAIVNIASIAGVIGANGLAVYAAAKHGVVGLTKSAALENARHGVRVNAICPTFSPTAMVTETITKGGPEVDLLAKGIPMRRLASVEDVVESVLYAASPASSFITGQTLNVDGGITAG
ncbi:SDR family NAD(P)-dependent oxidoreductase [Rhizobium sp. EC-SD404]|uniref:SDR family NAD(P)-dependent oxidoreductase n=1 Tax=Rhizobium sp. EC-SD404 TaxID=2038389 RepID=UPI00125C9C17|nr:SDR family NAD(P)-dependent oxidoreductase [Rhizobium sp. EC-SD404]VVT25001.1 Oxidoreductase [Rhizobium sp. EC-SD404]